MGLMDFDMAMILSQLEWNEFTVQLLATFIKVAVLVGLLLQVPPLMVWAERRVPGFMQRRKGPNRVGLGEIEVLGVKLIKKPLRLYGLLQSFADAVKLIFKEEIVPTGSNKFFYFVAPVFGVFPAFLIAMAIPYGNDITVAGYTIPRSVIQLDVGFLFIFAISSLAVYAVTLAGWASNNKYSLLGSLRASAQMISYEIPLGMSLIPIVLVFGTLDLNQIVLAQSGVHEWGVFRAPVSFVLFLICMFAETNRAPFDLAEGESELVAGFHTEFNSAKFAAFFLAEYVSMFVLSLLCATVFFGGWQVPLLSVELLNSMVAAVNPIEAWVSSSIIVTLIGHVVLLIKATFFMWLYIWVRWTLPRFRYDQLMSLGWKFMLPIGLANIVATAAIVAFIKF